MFLIESTLIHPRAEQVKSFTNQRGTVSFFNRKSPCTINLIMRQRSTTGESVLHSPEIPHEIHSRIFFSLHVRPANHPSIHPRAHTHTHANAARYGKYNTHGRTLPEVYSMEYPKNGARGVRRREEEEQRRGRSLEEEEEEVEVGHRLPPCDATNTRARTAACMYTTHARVHPRTSGSPR